MFTSTRLRGGGPKTRKQYAQECVEATKMSVLTEAARIDRIESCVICWDALKTCRLILSIPTGLPPGRKMCRHGYCEDCIEKEFDKVRSTPNSSVLGHPFYSCAVCQLPAQSYLKIPGPFSPEMFDES